MYADLSSIAARATDDSVLVVYQHLQKDATKRANDVERRLREMSAHLSIGFMWALQWADLAFLISVRDDRTAARIRRVAGAHAERHGLALFDGSLETSTSRNKRCRCRRAPKDRVHRSRSHEAAITMVANADSR